MSERSRCRCGGRRLDDGTCMYKCPPKPPKKIHQEGVPERREFMLSREDTREAYKRTVPERLRPSVAAESSMFRRSLRRQDSNLRLGD